MNWKKIKAVLGLSIILSNSLLSPITIIAEELTPPVVEVAQNQVPTGTSSSSEQVIAAEDPATEPTQAEENQETTEDPATEPAQGEENQEAVEGGVTPEQAAGEESPAVAAGEFRAVAEGMDIDQSKLIFTIKNNTASPLYTVDTHIGTILVDGSQLTEATDGLYIDITLPNQHIQSFEVPKASIIKSIETITNADGTITKRVYLNRVDATTVASFPFNVKFVNRLTPEGYEVKPTVTIHTQDGNLVKKADGTISFATKVDQPVLKKYAGFHSKGYSEQDAVNQPLYAGPVANGYVTADGATDIPFYFSLSTELGEERDVQSWGDGKFKTRLPEKIVVTDTLPTYVDSKGVTRTAVFDPAKNPGWVDNGDGTVSKTITSDNQDINSGGAGLGLHESKLVLSFPDAKALNTMSNTAKVDITPFNNENETKTLTDAVSLRLSGDIVGTGFFIKNNNNGHRLNLDYLSNHLVQTTWTLTMRNRSMSPMINVEIDDHSFDDRYYIRQLTIYNPNNIALKVYAVMTDGSEVEIPTTRVGSENKTEIIDQAAQSAIEEMVAKVEDGTMTAEETTAVSRTVAGVKVRTADGEEIQPGEYFNIFLYMGLRDPYNTEALKSPVEYKNTASVKGDVKVSDETIVPFSANASNLVRAVEKKEVIDVTKLTLNNRTGSLGESFTYRLGFKLDMAQARQMNNLKLIDVLPKGIVYNGYYMNNQVKPFVDNVEVIENYLGTGRQAVVISFIENFKVRELSSFTMDLGARITADAIPTLAETAENNNDNHVYLTADGFEPTPTNVSTQSTLKDQFDLNQNGNTDDVLLGAKSKTIVNLPTEIRSNKSISSDGKSWSTDILQTPYKGSVYYRLATQNYSTDVITKLNVYDRLPFKGDSNGSQFANILTGPVVVPAGFTVYYNSDPSISENPSAGIAASGWVTADQVSDFSSVTAINVVMAADRTVKVGEVVNFDIPMTTPDYKDGSLDTLTAANTFYVSRSKDENGAWSFGQGNTVTNQLPKNIPVSKVWKGSKQLDEITVELYRESDETTIESLVLNHENEFKARFENLDPLVTDYKVREVIENPEQYTSVVTGDANTGFVITNTLNEITVRVSKVWDDNNNQDGKRQPITYQLFGKDKEQPLETKTVPSDAEAVFENLPRFDTETKEAIAYTVTETPVPGYEEPVVSEPRLDPDGNIFYTVTNKRVPSTVEYSGQKIWQDANNQDGIRPQSITLRLFDDTNTEVRTLEVTGDMKADVWSYNFTDLPEYRDGQKITYHVKEEVLDENYFVSYDVRAKTITNFYNPAKATYMVFKYWDDAGNQDGLRPESIELQLYADGEAYGDPVTMLKEDGDVWVYSWSDLDLKKDGQFIHYTVKEITDVPGYATEVNNRPDGYTTEITNTHKPELIEVKGQKIWDDADNQDGKRPAFVTVNLLADGQEIAEKTVTAKDGWEYSFTDLPKFSDGTEIVYTVTEDSVENYSTEIDGYNITNTYTPEKTSVTATKRWEDANNQDGKRPDVLQVALTADGEMVDEAILMTAEDQWTFTWTDLPVYKNGQKIEYSVEEVFLPQGYSSSINNDNNGNIILTNTYVPETTALQGQKTWDDADNQDGLRPETVTINLLENGIEIDEQVISEATGWKYNFENLPVYRNGVALTYTVTEDVPEDYTVTYEENGDIVNTHAPGKTSVTVNKSWLDADNQDGLRPEEVAVQLVANDKVVGKAVKLTADNNWTYTWSDLDAKAKGQNIVYSVQEVKVPAGYASTVGDIANGNITITNSHTPELTKVNTTKVWDDADNQDGKRPSEIVVNLLANGQTVASQTVSAAENWTYTFTDLPKYEAGKEITYTVTEDSVEGYTTTIDGKTITNKRTPDETSATVTKRWEDGNNQDGKRPEFIKVQLLANDKEVGRPVTITSADDWTYTWTGLPVNQDGKAITYSVKEVSLKDGYVSTVDDTEKGNMIITNTYVPETTSVEGTKVWDDADNQDGKRPSAITVNVMNGDAIVASQQVSEATDWTFSFVGLPKYASGKEITYTVSEEPVADYKTTINGTTITNIYVPETTVVEGTKVWDDADNQDGKRPSSITVNLLANGKQVASQEVTSASNWAFSFTDLPKYASGTEIVYTVTENSVAGYSTVIDGTTITNSYTPEKTSVTVTKAWDDEQDKDGIRPDSIQVQLYANGQETGEVVTLTQDMNWTYTWTDLDAKATGDIIAYSVKEVLVAEGYTVHVNDTDKGNIIITNTHKPRENSITPNPPADSNDPSVPAPVVPPRAVLPKTGEDTNTSHILSMLGLLTIGLVLVAYFPRKRY